MKRLVMIIALLALLLVGAFPARAQGNLNRETLQLDSGYYVQSYRAGGGILLVRASPDWSSLHLSQIDQGVVSDLDAALLTNVRQPASIAVNACGQDIHLFIGWDDGTLQYIHWTLPDTMDECKKETVYLPVYVRGQP